jgi:ABC-type molybdate transport system substrate-binding protein
MKNNANTNLTPSPSSSTASTVTQDDNIDAIISIDKPMNKIFLQTEEVNATGLDPNIKSRDESTD